MNENILSFNVTNWITVVIMAVLGFAVLSVIAKFIQNQKQGVAANA